MNTITRKHPSRFRRLGLTLALASSAAVAGPLLTADPPTAQAGTGLIYNAVDADNDPYSGIYLRDGAAMSNVRRITSTYMLYGTRIELICGTWGEAVGPFANRRWHKVSVAGSSGGAAVGTQGWIADRYTNTPNKANEATPGEPECGATAPATPGGASVYFSGLGDAGWNYAKDYASVLLTQDGSRGYKRWTSTTSCGTANADDFASVIGGRQVTTLSGWSLGRLGPIYALKENSTVRANTRYVLMFDLNRPGFVGGS